ncbi:prepilin-type N-terminal cleavage/methylation domain-containing protein [Bacillus sp. FJAT-22090]|uniref:type IV pilus modification PilV family protein n=1 Tax=Bacillus sp. FJAT-22090 TaxID=1581038 RepID=UPI0016426306|nr:prepilin-type N-terminal cleavage/methylation domain-containing protein [Bacillus sp. FJAT-22090]
MIMKLNSRLNSKGLTLIEILVSIILITIILTAFFSLFIQSAKTGKTSEEVVDATYIAQAEMEKLYEISKNADLNSSINEEVKSLNYSQPNPKEDFFTKETNGLFVHLKLKKHFYPQMYYLVIEVFEQENGTRPRAKMETILEWGS